MQWQLEEPRIKCVSASACVFYESEVEAYLYVDMRIQKNACWEKDLLEQSLQRQLVLGPRVEVEEFSTMLEGSQKLCLVSIALTVLQKRKL